MTKQPSAAPSRTLAEAEREHILAVLKQTDWLIGVQDDAATRLGLPRTTLIYRMQKLGIQQRRLDRVRSVEQEHDGQPAAATSASSSIKTAPPFGARSR
jgi:hypothetical protein